MLREHRVLGPLERHGHCGVTGRRHALAQLRVAPPALERFRHRSFAAFADQRLVDRDRSTEIATAVQEPAEKFARQAMGGIQDERRIDGGPGLVVAAKGEGGQRGREMEVGVLWFNGQRITKRRGRRKVIASFERRPSGLLAHGGVWAALGMRCGPGEDSAKRCQEKPRREGQESRHARLPFGISLYPVWRVGRASLSGVTDVRAGKEGCAPARRYTAPPPDRPTASLNAMQGGGRSTGATESSESFTVGLGPRRGVYMARKCWCRYDRRRTTRTFNAYSRILTHVGKEPAHFRRHPRTS